jgi:cell wall-associated NlpC family hydrolase
MRQPLKKEGKIEEKKQTGDFMLYRSKYHCIFHLLLATLLVFGVCFSALPARAQEYPDDSYSYSAAPSNYGDPVRESVISTAMRFLGAPYWRGGNGPGYDCSGFVHKVLSKGGFRVPRSSRDFYRAGRKISVETAVQGDLLFFATCRRGISHVGIYLGNGKFIHSASSMGVRVDSLSEPYYRRTLVGATSLFSYPMLSLYY